MNDGRIIIATACLLFAGLVLVVSAATLSVVRATRQPVRRFRIEVEQPHPRCLVIPHDFRATLP